MIDTTIYNSASTAEAVARTVHIHGPSDLDINMTATAAFETATRISAAAIDALLDAPPPAPYTLS